MIMEVVLREGSLWEGALDGLIAVETSAEGAFYPVSVGNWREGYEYPDLWGWAIQPSQVEAFESLYMARRDDEVEKGFAGSFVHCAWLDDATCTASLVPAPVRCDEPLAGHTGETATRANFWSFGWAPPRFDLSCDLVTGRCRASVRGKGDLPDIAFKIAPGRLRPLATMGSSGCYRERRGGRDDGFMIYDGDYWGYVLGTDSAVLLRGTRRYGDEKGDDPVSLLFQTIRRAGLIEMRATWGFTL